MESTISSAEMSYDEWEKTRREFWEWRSSKKIDWIEIPEILWLRQLITTKWNLLGLDSSTSHWFILELSRLERTLSDEFIARMNNLWITRDNNPIFDVYCRHLERKPEQNIQKSLVTSSLNSPRTTSHALQRTTEMAKLAWDILCGLVVPQAKK